MRGPTQPRTANELAVRLLLLGVVTVGNLRTWPMAGRASGLLLGICSALLTRVALDATKIVDRAQQGRTPVFKGRLDLVRTEVDVIDNRTGAPVTGLSPKHFSIFENGTRQEIVSFAAPVTADPRAGDGVGATDTSVPAVDRRVVLLIFNSSLVMRGPVKPHEGPRSCPSGRSNRPR